MPWNESHLHIRSDHHDPSTCEKDSIRTITINEADGIEALVGKPPFRDYTVTLSFLFAKGKGWTVEKAKDWFKEHEHTAEIPLGYFPVGGSAALNRLTVGDLVGKTTRATIDFPSLETYQSNAANSRRLRRLREEIGQPLNTSEARSNPIQTCSHDSACSRLHTLLSVRCSGVVCTRVNANSTSRFDPGLPTIGDLVGSKTVEAAASGPPAMRRIDGKLDLSQPTVGDLVTKTLRGHTSLRSVSIEPGDITVHPSRIREVSRS